MDERPGYKPNGVVDYFYCGICGQHVPCIPLGHERWEVQCSQCVGDCGLCACHGHRRAAQAAVSPDPHVHVAQGKHERPIQPEEGKHE